MKESRMVIGADSIQKVVAQIVQEFHPERVILFGSYASGTPTPESDVDLLVVMPCEGKETRKAIEILHTIDPKIPIDLLVRTPERLEQRLTWNDFFLQEIMEKGQLLYEAPHPKNTSRLGFKKQIPLSAAPIICPPSWTCYCHSSRCGKHSAPTFRR